MYCIKFVSSRRVTHSILFQWKGLHHPRASCSFFSKSVNFLLNTRGWNDAVRVTWNALLVSIMPPYVQKHVFWYECTKSKCISTYHSTPSVIQYSLCIKHDWCYHVFVRLTFYDYHVNCQHNVEHTENRITLQYKNIPGVTVLQQDSTCNYSNYQQHVMRNKAPNEHTLNANTDNSKPSFIFVLLSSFCFPHPVYFKITIIVWLMIFTKVYTKTIVHFWHGRLAVNEVVQCTYLAVFLKMLLSPLTL